MLDALGHPIRAGDTVLTSHHYGVHMNYVTTVKRVTKKNVYVELKIRHYCRCTKSTVTLYQELRRPPYKFIVVNEQLKHNKEHYPENQL